MTFPRLLMVAFVAGLGVSTAAAQPMNERRAVTVQGRGSTDVAPDIGTVSVGVTTRAAQATAALDANSVAAKRVIDHAKTSGIAPGDIRTGSVSLAETFQDRPAPDGRRKPDGYVATNIVVLKVRDLKRMGALLREVVDEGANRINGVSFGLAEPEPVQDAMRKEAVADARRKAALFAEAAGAKLGPVLTIADTQGYRPFEAAADMPMRSSAAPSVPIEAGLLTVTAEVTVAWALE